MPSRPLLRRRVVTAATAVVLVGLAAPSLALADDSPPAVDQYVETLPSAGGSAATKTKRHQPALTNAAKERVQRAAPKDAALLENVATSSTYGAPARPSPAKKSSTSPTKQAETTASPQRSLAGATVSAASEEGGTRLLVLALFLVLGTCILVAERVVRGRRQRP